jgi:hypothetical protein
VYFSAEVLQEHDTHLRSTGELPQMIANAAETARRLVSAVLAAIARRG